MTNKPLIQCLKDDLVELLAKYADQGITVGETIGVLEMVKMDTHIASTEETDDEAQQW